MKCIWGIILLIVLYSCSEKKGKENCSYKLGDFFKKYDTSKVKILTYGKMTEVLDNENPTEEKGIYKFDENKILRFYGYIVDKNNSYNFGVEYDSVGNRLSIPKSHIVRWFINNRNNDSIKVSFLLYSIGFSYGGIKILSNNKSLNVPLFESKYFSNLLAGDIILEKTNRVYISGDFRDNCNGLKQVFKDSLIW